MLRSVKMTCFRKHVEKTINFVDGLNVMKAPNEGGKSTVIEAVLYALFGAKSLRNTLAETVTWGHKEKDLSVELVIDVNDRLFKFSRSKAGAECAYDGGLVTGQNEVSAFAAEVLGTDANTACRLMMANQTNLRGALEAGPKAVAQQIENLSDFDLFDRLLDAAQTKLATGPSGVLEERVRHLDNMIAECDTKEPDYSEIDQRINDMSMVRELAEKHIAETEPLREAAQNEYSNAQSQQRMRDMLSSNLEKAKTQYELHKVQKAEADVRATTPHENIEVLKEHLARVNERQKVLKTHAELARLMKTYPDMYWEGSRAEYESVVSELEARIEKLYDDIRVIEADVQKTEQRIHMNNGKLIHSTTCPTCKQELKDKEMILASNAELEKLIENDETKLAELRAEVQAQGGKLQAANSDLRDLRALRAAAVPFETFLAANGQYVEEDDVYYPPRLVWKGNEPPGEDVDAKTLEDRISAAESAKEAAQRANARSAALTETIKEDEDTIERLQQQLKDTPEVDVEAAHQKARNYGNQIAAYRIDIEGANKEIVNLQGKRREMELGYHMRLDNLKKIKVDRDTAVADLEKLNFNNGLVKKIRQARPHIADKLWNSVLASVSVMFSQLRGEQTVILKGSDGFTANGNSVSSLSGSTLDILGLAIRIALVKTFLPHTDFLVLDEPQAACDDDRANTMLGFLATCGFKQILLVSHETSAEAAADTVISL